MESRRDIIIIGGGFAGTQLAARLLRRLPRGVGQVLRSADSYPPLTSLLAASPPIASLPGIRRFYPRAAAGEISVTLVQDIDRLLPELPAGLGEAARRSLAARGVAIRLGARAAAIDAAGLSLADGGRIESG